jgi:hypothetical protein
MDQKIAGKGVRKKSGKTGNYWIKIELNRSSLEGMNADKSKDLIISFLHKKLEETVRRAG